MPDAIYFDMDGTIADLYGFDNWLNYLLADDTTPYSDCEVLPWFNEVLYHVQALRELGVTIGVISWGAKDSSKKYHAATRKAKLNWLNNHGFEIDEYHVQYYGTPKINIAKIKKNVILVDDDENVRANWDNVKSNRTSISPEECVSYLHELLECMHESLY